MMYKSFSSKKLFVKIVVVLLIVGTLAIHPVVQHNEKTTLEAGFALEPTQIVNTTWSSLTTQLEGTLVLKEFNLDFLLYTLTKIALSTIIQSLIQWVNSGFNGAPTFVTDLKGYMLSIADQAAADFLFSEDGLGLTGLETLCSPFSLDIQFALTQSVARHLSEEDDGYQAQCSLSDIAGNVQNFMQGDFAGGGGWQNWIQMTQHPGQNTSIGAYMQAESELFQYMARQEANERQTLNFGHGFLSMKDEEGNITTPGDVIAGQINKALGAGQDVLVEADEINELITALFYALVNRVLGGVGGLAGSDGYGDGYTGSDFFDDDSVIDFDDVDDFIDPGIPNEPTDPTDPVDPSVDPVDPFTDEPLDPTIPGTGDPTVDPVDGDIDDVGGELPSEDPVAGSATTTDPTDPVEGGGGGGGGGVDPV